MIEVHELLNSKDNKSINLGFEIIKGQKLYEFINRINKYKFGSSEHYSMRLDTIKYMRKEIPWYKSYMDNEGFRIWFLLPIIPFFLKTYREYIELETKLSNIIFGYQVVLGFIFLAIGYVSSLYWLVKFCMPWF